MLGYCRSPGVCTCDSNWGGAQCNVALCPSTCRNGGYCTADYANNHICVCPALRGGSDCSQVATSSLSVITCDQRGLVSVQSSLYTQWARELRRRWQLSVSVWVEWAQLRHTFVVFRFEKPLKISGNVPLLSHDSALQLSVTRAAVMASALVQTTVAAMTSTQEMLVRTIVC